MTLSPGQIASVDAHPAPRASVSLRTLTAALVALFAFDNIALLGLLGLSPPVVVALALVLPGALAFLCWKAMRGAARVGLRTLLFCLAIAFVLLVLGGEGRLFYAPPDWQIRDAVLADMGNHRWPFAYGIEGKEQLLRAPVGMYLVPALLGGASQVGRDWTLLAHNGLILGLLLAQGAVLFDGVRARLIALVIFVMFSGFDILGVVLAEAATGDANWNHIERWASNYQYSAHITQLFWAPQHALAGWTVALFYLLWRTGRAPVGLFAASLPLIALWSPLILFGALPFAVFAAIRVLATQDWRARDVLIAMFAVLLAVPALVYLSVDAAAIGAHLRPPTLLGYILILLFEVLPFILPLLSDRTGGTDRATILIAGLCLLLMPLWTMGISNDFQMRGSIMPLALVAIAFAQWAGRVDVRGQKMAVVAIMALGSVTGIVEISHAFRFAASPPPLCSLAGAWQRQAISGVPYASYLAARDAFPVGILPRDRVGGATPPTCWDRPWDMAGARP